MTDETYDGWTNRETWALMLHINNDQGLQSMFHERASVALEENPGDWNGRVGEVVKDLAETLFVPLNYKEEFGDLPSEAMFGKIQDIGSLWRVDWREVERSIVGDIKED